MKRLLRKGFFFIALLPIIAIFTTTSLSYSPTYNIIQITDNSYDDQTPHINNNGYVVWSGRGGQFNDSDYEIFLYNGTNIVQITTNDYQTDISPRINDNEHIAWHGTYSGDEEIFLYDGTNIEQITDNSYYDDGPRLNNNGYMAWFGGDCPNSEIFLYDGTNITQITNNSIRDENPQINNNGSVVWWAYDELDGEIFLYNGTTAIQLTDNSYSDFNQQINDNGYVVWQGSDGSDDEIFLYNGSGTTQITNNSYYDGEPQINNNGYVVWQGGTGSDSEIFLYNGSDITRITNNSYWDGYPQINDNGYVVWQGSDGSDYEIFLYDGTKIIQITDNSLEDRNPEIGNNGYVTWKGNDGSDWEIFLAIPVPQADISVAPTSFSFFASRGGSNPSSQTLSITNTGGGTLNWSVSDDATWLNLSPISGTDNGMVTVSVDIAGLTAGAYNATITVAANTVNSPVTIPVTLTITPPPLILLSPNGGEAIPSGSTYTIRWDAPPRAELFNLMYSMNNGTTWKPIAGSGGGCTDCHGTSGSGTDGCTACHSSSSLHSIHTIHHSGHVISNATSNDWRVPCPKNNKKNCLIKITGYNSSGVKTAEDTSDSTFTIEVVRLISPNGGQTLTSGSTSSITWRTNCTIRPVAKVRLFYTKDGGNSWTVIKTFIRNTGSYKWTVPNESSSSCKVKVVLKDANGNIIGNDLSDTYFTIQPF